MNTEINNMANCRCMIDTNYINSIQFANRIHNTYKHFIKHEIIEYLIDHFGAAPIQSLTCNLHVYKYKELHLHILKVLEEMEKDNLYGIFTTADGIKWIYLKQKQVPKYQQIEDTPKNKLRLIIDQFDNKGVKTEVLRHEAEVFEDLEIEDIKDFVSDTYEQIIIAVRDFQRNNMCIGYPLGILLQKP